MDKIVRKSEGHFIELSKELPSFAGYHLDRQSAINLSDDKLVIWLKGKKNIGSAIEKVKSYFNTKFGKSIKNFGSSEVIIKEAEFNFKQLQAFRDVLHKPAFETKGVTMIDLAEDKNRIVIGIEAESQVDKVEAVLSKLPLPREAILIEVIGSVNQSYSIKDRNKKISKPLSMLIHQTLRDKIRPLTGGLKIYYYNSNCTLGMIAKYGSIDVFLTNSHCGEFASLTPTVYYQPESGYYIGEEIYDVPEVYSSDHQGYIRYSDAAIIRLDEFDYQYGTVAFTNGRGLTWGDNDHTQIEIVDDNVGFGSRILYVEEQQSLIDLPVAKVGQATGTTVGYVKRTCANFLDAETSDRHVMVCQSSASYYNQQGDSGAPVFTDLTTDTDKGEGKLLGMHYANLQNYDGSDLQEGIYSPLAGIREDLETSNQSLSFMPVSFSLFGVNNIERTGIYTYDVIVNQSTGSPNYQWSIKWEGSSSWNVLGNNSSQNVSVTDGKDFVIKAEVSDNVSSSISEINVTVVTEECAPFEPCIN